MRRWREYRRRGTCEIGEAGVWAGLRGVLCEDHLVGIKERVDVLGAHPVASADFAGLQLSGVDEPLHVTRGNVQDCSGFIGGHDGFWVTGAC